MSYSKPSLHPTGGGPKRRPRVRSGGALLFALLMVSAALMVLSRLDHPAVKALRAGINDLMAHPLALAHQATEPLRRLAREVRDYPGMVAEIDRLKQENAALAAQAWQAKSAQARVEELGRLVNAVSDRSTPRVTARAVAESRGPFAHALLLSAGRAQGVKPGHPVVGPEGLVGRVIEASGETARVLLLTDFASRVPVLIGADATRAVMLGDRGPLPRIAYLPPGAPLAGGDDVYTSGDGGLFPRGLRIGTLVQGETDWRVDLAAPAAHIDFVSVLMVEMPGSAAWQEDTALPDPRRPLSKAAAMRAAADTDRDERP